MPRILDFAYSDANMFGCDWYRPFHAVMPAVVGGVFGKCKSDAFIYTDSGQSSQCCSPCHVDFFCIVDVGSGVATVEYFLP